MAKRADPGAKRAARAAGRRCGGFTFLGLMFLIALMGLLASAAATTWTFTSRRDKELDLLFVGHEYRMAIVRYAAAHVRARQPYPTELKQLLGDGDQLVPVRYLRRLYFDPVTGSAEWGLVRTPEGGITGIYSLSQQQPVRIAAPPGPSDDIDFVNAKTYRDWIFVAAPTTATSAEEVPGWDYARDGAPPLKWDSTHPKPVPSGND